MTVSSTSPIVRYQYQGPGDYTFDFRIFKDTDLLVLIIDDEGNQNQLTLSLDYIVTTIEGIDGGTVTVLNPSTPGGTLEIRRVLPVTQEVDWVNNDPLDAETLEDSFDRIVMILQQMTVITLEGNPTTNWKGVWTPTTFYQVNDIVTAPETSPKAGNLYACGIEHTSTNDFDADLTNGFWKLALDVEYIEQLRDECEAYRDECAQYAADAAASAQRAQNAADNAELYRDQCQISEANAANSAQNAANCSQSASDFADESEAHANTSLGHANTAQLRAWEAEAERLTADSYATQAEDVPVDIYTSNGDGTFTATPTSPAEFSSFHWSKKASSVVTGVASITWTAPLQNTGDATDHIAQIDPAKVAEWDTVTTVAKDKADYVVDATGSVDPNGFLESYLVTDHANGPESGTLFHIYQKGVSPVGGAPLEIGDERFQKAVEYQPGPGNPARTFSRSYHSDDGWTAWSEGGGGGGGGGGGLTWVAPKTADFTAVSGEGYPVDTQTGAAAVTMQLPATPTENMQVGAKDFNNTFHQYPFYVDPQGEEIDNQGTGIMEINARGWGGTFIYSGGQWMVVHSTPMNVVANKPMMHVQHQEVTGVDGGSTIQGFNIRPFNSSLVNEISGAVLNGDGTVLLPAGEYYFTYTGQHESAVSNHVKPMVKNSGGTILIVGSNMQSNDTQSSIRVSAPFFGKILLSAPDTLTFGADHGRASSNSGLGIASGVGPYEVYGDLCIWRLDTDIKTVTVPDPQKYLRKPLLWLEERQALGVNAGDAFAGDTIRPLNTLVGTNEIPGSSHDGAGLISLPAGEFEFEAFAAAYNVGMSKLMLMDSPGNNILVEGVSSTTTGLMVESRLTGRLLLASPTTIWLNSYNQTFQSATGKGFDTGFGTHNLYSGIKIFQLDAAVEAPIYYGQLGVKSVQRFTGSIGQGQTLDISISPVDMSKSFITMNWKGQVNCYTRLTAPNNVQVYNSYSSTTYDFEVVELY